MTPAVRRFVWGREPLRDRGGRERWGNDPDDPAFGIGWEVAVWEDAHWDDDAWEGID